MSEAPKRHHTVPKFYLEGFAAGDMLRAVNVKSGDAHGLNIVNATAESHFYTLPDHPTDPGVFEAFLSEVEGYAAEILRGIVADEWPLDPESRGVFAQFMTLQFMRVQSHRSQMHHVIAADLRRLVEEDPAEFKRVTSLPGAPADVDFASGDLPPLVSSAVHVQQITQLVPQLTPFLLARPWLLVRFDAPSLITSDEPLTPLTRPTEPQNVGLGLENSWALMFPLTRTRGLVMFRDPGAMSQVFEVDRDIEHGQYDSTCVGDADWSKVFNTNTVIHANRFVFHHPDDSDLLPDGVVALAKRGGRINLEDVPEGLRPAP